MAFRRRGDRGAGLLEYVGLTLVSAGVLAGAFTGFPKQVAAGVEAAVCRVLGEEGCGDGRPGAGAPAGPPPRPCSLSEDKTVRTTDLQFLMHSDRSQATNVVARRSDGTLQETFTIDSKSGFAPQGGYGIKAGPVKAGFSAGGGVLSGDVDTVTVDFANERQREQYHQALTAEFDRVIRTKGLPGFNDEATAEFDGLEGKVADRQGLTYSTYRATGRSAYGKADVSLGKAPKKSESGVTAGVLLGGVVENGGESGVTVKHAPGQWLGETTETRKTAMTLGWDARAGATLTTPGVSAVATAGAGGQSVDGSTVSITRDPNGNPVKATFSTSAQSQFDASGNGSVTWTADGKKKPGETGSAGRQAQGVDGEQTTRDIEVDLRNDPRGLRVAEALMDFGMVMRGEYPGGAEALARDYDELVRSKGQVFTAVHDRSSGDKSTGGWSASYGVKLAGAEDSEERSQLRLRDAYIEDPRTGQRRPWTGCKP